jgi:hypothetical protein
MSYAGTTTTVAPEPTSVIPGGRASRRAELQSGSDGASPSQNHAKCACRDHSPGPSGAAGECSCRQPRPLVTESHASSRVNPVVSSSSIQPNGRPDFARMSPAERLAYHRQRLGLGR